MVPLNNWVSDEEEDDMAIKKLKLEMVSRLENTQVVQKASTLFVLLYFKLQISALKRYYGKVRSTQEERIAQLEFLSNFVIPFIALSFIALYWVVGLLMYYRPQLFEHFLTYDVETF